MAGPLESPGGGGPPAKPSPPKQPSVVLLADAKITVQASIPIVFEALVNPEQLGVWWAQDVEVEAEESGRYEGTTSEGRVEGTITAIDGRGLALPHADAQRREAVVRPLLPRRPTTHLMDHRAHDPGPRAPERVAQRDRPPVHVRDFGAEAEGLHDHQRLNREGFVELNQADVLDPKFCPGERLAGRRDGTEAHRPGLDAGSRGGDDSRKRGDPEFPRLAIAHHQQRRGAVRDAARVSRGHGATLPERGTELREGLEGRVGSRRLVPTDGERLRLPLRNRDGEDLLRELAAFNRGDGPPMALEGELILVLPRSLRVPFPEVLRRLPHRVVPVLGLEPRVREPPTEGRVPSGHVAHGAVEILRDRVRRPGHALDAARDEGLALADLDGPRRRVDRREAGRAEAVERHRRHGHGEPREQRGHPRDVAVVLPGLVRAAQVDLLNERGIDARAAHDLADDERRQVVRPDILQRPVVTTHRRPNGIDDHGFGHRPTPIGILESPPGIWTSGCVTRATARSHTPHRRPEALEGVYLYLEVRRTAARIYFAVRVPPAVREPLCPQLGSSTRAPRGASVRWVRPRQAPGRMPSVHGRIEDGPLCHGHLLVPLLLLPRLGREDVQGRRVRGREARHAGRRRPGGSPSDRGDWRGNHGRRPPRRGRADVPLHPALEA